MKNKGLKIGKEQHGNYVYFNTDKGFPQLLIDYGNSVCRLSKEDSERILDYFFKELNMVSYDKVINVIGNYDNNK